MFIQATLPKAEKVALDPMPAPSIYIPNAVEVSKYLGHGNSGTKHH